MECRNEKWQGCDIRFLDVDGKWWCIYDDILNALGIHNSNYYELKLIDKNRNDLIKRVEFNGEMTTVVSELGIYEIFYICDGFLETTNFRHWSGTVMEKLRSKSGLQPYEVMHMLDEDVQQDISRMIDTLYWDDEKKMLMQSVTVQGGDVEQLPFME